ncbi:MAG: methionine--tRNA ligase, partial [Pseudomonadota bacterium]
RMAQVLYTVADTVRQVAILAQPVMPDACAKLLDLVAVHDDKRDFAALGESLVPDTALPKPEGVFPRYVEQDAA